MAKSKKAKPVEVEAVEVEAEAVEPVKTEHDALKHELCALLGIPECPLEYEKALVIGQRLSKCSVPVILAVLGAGRLNLPAEVEVEEVAAEDPEEVDGDGADEAEPATESGTE